MLGIREDVLTAFRKIKDKMNGVETYTFEIDGTILVLEPNRVSIISKEEKRVMTAGTLEDMCVTMAIARNYIFELPLQKIFLDEKLFMIYNGVEDAVMMEQLIMTITKLQSENGNIEIVVVPGVNFEIEE